MKAKTTTVMKNARQLFEAVSYGRKEEFLRLGRTVLKNVRDMLGVEGDVRVNRAGDGVMGDVVLHTDRIYVCMSDTVFGGEATFMYRTCKGRKDYSGGGNNWYKYSDLMRDPEKFVAVLRELALNSRTWYFEKVENPITHSPAGRPVAAASGTVAGGEPQAPANEVSLPIRGG